MIERILDWIMPLPKPQSREWKLCDRGAVVRPYEKDGWWFLTQQGWNGPEGWPQPGDTIWLPHDRDNLATTYARYRVTEFRYELDPEDMYLLRAEWVPANAQNAQVCRKCGDVRESAMVIEEAK